VVGDRICRNTGSVSDGEKGKVGFECAPQRLGDFSALSIVGAGLQRRNWAAAAGGEISAHARRFQDSSWVHKLGGTMQRARPDAAYLRRVDIDFQARANIDF
jgi:hypothetical protein